ncbi:MAG TPA: membrane protein insertase YidC [Acidobacteriota bacterium]|nr:membrane protein insertase YidC [Acidobacteriota bacterium]HMZ78284.1 membrane protein insertase YidC [Acidobacteriota bacterium]HNB69740.1 membrane protein insertase YidC [Acidobacteriota bacterium]HNC42676.1 membrane protein insertase YidC [Acidobacteriota bacterium]HND17779.1 membrane protein insertase YidC [Acidobacteriota bacterium]
MGEKPRYFLALFLSFLVLLGWQYFFAPPPSPPKPALPATAPSQPSTQSPSATSQPAAVASQGPLPTPEVTPEQSITVETKLWKAVFSNRGGVMTSWILKQLPNGRPLKNSLHQDLELVSAFSRKHAPSDKTLELGAPLRLAIKSDTQLETILNSVNFRIDPPVTNLTVGPGETKELSFTYEDPTQGIQVRKSLVFQGDEKDGAGYTFDYTVDVKKGQSPVQANTVLGPNFGDQSVHTFDSYHTPPQAVVVTTKPYYRPATDVKPDQFEKNRYQNVHWAALADHYFAMAVIPEQTVPEVVLSNRKVTETVAGTPTERDYVAVLIPLANGVKNTFYIGPKDRNYLLPVNQRLGNRVDLEVLVDYGIFSFLVRPLVPLLDVSVKILHRYTNNYGWAIIAITIIVNTLLFPLKWKSSVALRKTAEIQPRVKEIQDRIKSLPKNDPRVLEGQLELARLMREGNPLMGCLPLLLQMPIFFAFFIYLQISVDIRQEHFISWLNDLSAPDRLHILPIAMCVTQIGSTLLMPSPATDDPAQKMQKTLMTWVFPIVLTYFFFWTAPSGLVLYWMAGNIIGISQQLVINKLNPIQPPPVNTPQKAKKPAESPA